MTQQRSDLRVGRRASLVGLTSLVGTAALGGAAASAVVERALETRGPASTSDAEALLGAADRNAGYEAIYPVTGLSDRERVERAHGLTPAGADVRALLGPLADGATFAAADGTQWQVAAAYEPRGGAIPVVLAARSALGTKVSVELLRDGGGAVAPARAAGIAAFVTNRGDGTTATREQQGLAAMAFVAALAPRVATASVVAQLSTHADRVSAVVPV